MQRTHINLAEDASRGIAALKGTGVPAVFSGAVRVDLPGGARLAISGMVATDASGQVTHPTIGEQTRVVLDKIKAGLAREEGTMDDIVRVRVYVTQLDPEALREVHRARSAYWSPGRYPASTLVRVAGLAREGVLIEIDADALLPAR